jgi:hypothetical protein
MDQLFERNWNEKAVKKRAEILIKEIRAQTEEVQKKDPGSDEQLIFEGWIIQKIAGLQIGVEELLRQVDRLIYLCKLNKK